MDILSKTYLIQRAAKEFEVHWQGKRGSSGNPEISDSGKMHQSSGYHITHLWVFIQRNWKQDLNETPALTCSWQHYSYSQDMDTA